MRATRDLVSVAAAAFVLLFTFCHLMGASSSQEARKKGYFATLTIFTLLLTCFVLVAGAPPAMVAAVSSLNVMVVAIYYSLINTSYVKGTSFLLHGGVACILLFSLATDRLSARGAWLSSGLLAGGLLVLNACLQLSHEQRKGVQIYPGCASFAHPVWRLAFLPIVGALVAAWISSV